MATTRNPNARSARKVKPTIVEAETTVVGENPNKTLYARFDEFMTEHVAIAGVCSWKRAVVAWTASVLTIFGAGYLIGQITAAAMIGAVVMTGGTFLAYVILILGLVISYYAVGRIGRFMFHGIATGHWTLDNSVRDYV